MFGTAQNRVKRSNSKNHSTEIEKPTFDSYNDLHLSANFLFFFSFFCSSLYKLLRSTVLQLSLFLSLSVLHSSFAKVESFMASITATCSPTSLQIRLAFSGSNCRKFPTVIHSRLSDLDRRARVLCTGKNGNELDSVSNQVVPKGLSGCSDSESGEQSASSHKKKGSYEGVAGIGVVQSFFFQGLPLLPYFSSESASKQQMKS